MHLAFAFDISNAPEDMPGERKCCVSPIRLTACFKFLKVMVAGTLTLRFFFYHILFLDYLLQY